MYVLQIFFQRRRRLLTQLGVLLAVGLGGLLAILPRVDAHDGSRLAVADIGAKSFLLSPERMSGQQFSGFYAPAHR